MVRERVVGAEHLATALFPTYIIIELDAKYAVCFFDDGVVACSISFGRTQSPGCAQRQNFG